MRHWWPASLKSSRRKITGETRRSNCPRDLLQKKVGFHGAALKFVQLSTTRVHSALNVPACPGHLQVTVVRVRIDMVAGRYRIYPFARCRVIMQGLQVAEMRRNAVIINVKAVNSSWGVLVVETNTKRASNFFQKLLCLQRRQRNIV